MSNKKPNYQTIVDLIQELSPKYKPNHKDITWFASYHLADELMEMGTKELARMIDSDTKINIQTIKDVNSWLSDSGYPKGKLKRLLREFGYNKKYTGE